VQDANAVILCVQIYRLIIILFIFMIATAVAYDAHEQCCSSCYSYQNGVCRHYQAQQLWVQQTTQLHCLLVYAKLAQCFAATPPLTNLAGLRSGVCWQ
jgi:hypothetical protein